MLIRQKSVKAKLKKLTYHDGDFIIPAGYELVSMLPTSYKFKSSDNDPIDIHLKHKVIVITPNDPKQSTDKLLDNPSKNYLTGVSQNDLNEMIKRQIMVVRPDGNTIDAGQLITLTRTATLDEVTRKVIKYSNWTIGSFSEYNAPEIQGYTPNRNSKAVESEDSTYVLNTSDKGWLSNTALNEMAKEAKGDNFLDLFNCRSNDVKQKLGFRSWDDFFTRTFKEDWTYI